MSAFASRGHLYDFLISDWCLIPQPGVHKKTDWSTFRKCVSFFYCGREWEWYAEIDGVTERQRLKAVSDSSGYPHNAMEDGFKPLPLLPKCWSYTSVYVALGIDTKVSGTLKKPSTDLTTFPTCLLILLSMHVFLIFKFLCTHQKKNTL